MKLHDSNTIAAREAAAKEGEYPVRSAQASVKRSSGTAKNKKNSEEQMELLVSCPSALWKDDRTAQKLQFGIDGQETFLCYRLIVLEKSADRFTVVNATNGFSKDG